MHPHDRDSSSRRAAEAVFPGGGEMGRLCREVNWASTPLGPVEGWPQSLRTAAGMVIAQGIAQSLCWGPELVQIYNDEYRVIMRDKHPAGLGRPVLENWSEIRGDIGPLFERVLGGETVYFEDLHFRVARHGALEDAYFTFSYSPVRVESGEVGGALINCFETTRQVHTRAIQAERDRLSSIPLSSSAPAWSTSSSTHPPSSRFSADPDTPSRRSTRRTTSWSGTATSSAGRRWRRSRRSATRASSSCWTGCSRRESRSSATSFP